MQSKRGRGPSGDEKVLEKRKGQPPRKNQSFVVLSDIEGLIQHGSIGFFLRETREKKEKEKVKARFERSLEFGNCETKVYSFNLNLNE